MTSSPGTAAAVRRLDAPVLAAAAPAGHLSPPVHGPSRQMAAASSRGSGPRRRLMSRIKSTRAWKITTAAVASICRRRHHRPPLPFRPVLHYVVRSSIQTALTNSTWPAIRFTVQCGGHGGHCRHGRPNVPSLFWAHPQNPYHPPLTIILIPLRSQLQLSCQLSALLLLLCSRWDGLSPIAATNRQHLS
jgi:hypothetical protein